MGRHSKKKVLKYSKSKRKNTKKHRGGMDLDKMPSKSPSSLSPSSLGTSSLGPGDEGKSANINITRHGDLLGDMILEISIIIPFENPLIMP